MKFIWVTRGRSWGFRFLRDGGYTDPLPIYEEAFTNISYERQGIDKREDLIAIRFADPQGRKDEAGRIIPHNFVIFDFLDADIDSLEDGISAVWPLVEDEFAEVWDSE